MVSRTASDLAGSTTFANRQKALPVNVRPKSETAYYLANIGKATSIVAFVGNHRLFSYAMTAYGLEDRNYAKGLMTQILQDGLASGSMLEDRRFKAFVAAFDFAGKGPGVTQLPAATTETVSLYLARTAKSDAAAIAGDLVALIAARPALPLPVDPELNPGTQNNQLGGM